MKGYILEKYNQMGDVYTSPRLIEEAAGQDIDLKMIGLRDTYLSDGKLYNDGIALERRDFIINRYKWGKLRTEINGLCDKTYNRSDVFGLFVNKYEQLKRIDSKFFHKPRYILGTCNTPYDEMTALLGNEIVAKGLENSMGRDIFLLQSEADYRALSSYGEEREWLYEEFISDSFGRDLRVFSIRGTVVASMVRSSESDFRSNVALGASCTPYEADEEVRKIAEDIYRQTELDFAGIDLLFGRNGFYFCEVNVMPGIEGIEKATGVNVAKGIIDMIKGDFS